MSRRPIDLRAAAGALGRLDALALAHPGLVRAGADTPENRAAWEAALQEVTDDGEGEGERKGEGEGEAGEGPPEGG